MPEKKPLKIEEQQKVWMDGWIDNVSSPEKNAGKN